MIIWVASYPRSGNRLTRTLLHKTMGIGSTTDEFNSITHENSHWSENYMDVSCGWDEFYRQASQSDEVFLVKTHRPPRDGQPAIYLVRDGRKSCLSYSHFHHSHTSPPLPSLLEIVMGHDFYGSWSDHYRMWEKRGNLLVLRFEELVNASDELLKRLAEWVHYSGEIMSWVNPFEEERRRAPKLVREGKIEWGEDPAWTKMINAVFFKLHGDLMIKLGYASPEAVAEATRDMPDEWLELIQISQRLLADKKSLQLICEERQSVINELKLACDERLVLIEQLSKRGA